jgi:hypothetical protein
MQGAYKPFIVAVVVLQAACCRAEAEELAPPPLEYEAVFSAVPTATGLAPQLVADGPAPFRFSKTLFRWTGQAPNYETGGPPAMITDRPHFSEASNLVGLGRVQVETGYTIGYDRSGTTSVQSQSFGEPLVRVGLFAEWFEFRIADTYVTEQVRDTATGNSHYRGLDDLYLGAKVALTEQMGVLPEIAIFPQMRVPSGADHFSSQRVLPGYNLAYSWMLNDWIELECNSQMNRRLDDAGHYYVEVIQTANLEYELTEKLNAFTEWFVFTPCGAVAAQTQHYFHGGFWYLVTPNMQFDIHAGFGVSQASDDLGYTGGGFSFRY